MSKSLAHLTKEKKAELKEILELIKVNVPETLVVILFGSHARGDFIEYDQRVEFGLRTTFRSDFDLLVLTPKNNKKSYQSIKHRLNNTKFQFLANGHVETRTPVQFINETLEDFNKKIKQGRYFYTDIKKQGIILYNPNKCKIQRIRKLNFVQIKDLAVEYYNEKFGRANSFMEVANFDLEREDYRMASFHLHQAAEMYLTAMILTTSLYSPKEHDLVEFIDRTKRFTTKAVEIFPFYNTKRRDPLFQLLLESYVQGRYNKDFIVTRDDIEQLIDKLEVLRDNTKEVCDEKIAEYERIIETGK